MSMLWEYAWPAMRFSYYIMREYTARAAVGAARGATVAFGGICFLHDMQAALVAQKSRASAISDGYKMMRRR